MNKAMGLLITVLILAVLPVPAGAIPYVSHEQRIHFSANHAYYWAMIWDYTNAARESATTGYVNVDSELEFRQNLYNEVHVAYLYDFALGRFIEAQAMRNVFL